MQQLWTKNEKASKFSLSNMHALHKQSCDTHYVTCIADCILPIFLYGSKVWSEPCTLAKEIVTGNIGILRHILHIHWKNFVSNDVVLSRTGQPLPSDTIHRWRLFFFGHLCYANTHQDKSKIPKTGDAELEDQGKPCWKRWKTICTHSISAWQQQGGTLGTDWHGNYSWRRLLPFDMLWKDRVAECLETETRLRCSLNACTKYKTIFTFWSHN